MRPKLTQKTSNCQDSRARGSNEPRERAATLTGDRVLGSLEVRVSRKPRRLAFAVRSIELLNMWLCAAIALGCAAALTWLELTGAFR